MINLLGAPGELIGETFEVVTGKDGRHVHVTATGDNGLVRETYRHVTLEASGAETMLFLDEAGECATCLGEHVNLLEDLS
jgi:hypothetical protein